MAMERRKMMPFHPMLYALAALLGLAADFGASAQELSAVRQSRADMPTPRKSLTRSGISDERGSAVLQSSAPSAASSQSANPLWAIPLASLAPTRERPIFSPSRRPPADGPPAASAQRPPMPPAEEKPPKPPFILLAAIAGENDEIALLLEETTKIVVRLRLGQSHSGWTLRSVRGREATLQGYQQTATLSLPNPLASQTALKP